MFTLFIFDAKITVKFKQRVTAMQNSKMGLRFLAQFKGLISLMRPKQWIKNFFVFAPLLYTGRFTNLIDVRNAIIATFFFCIASSAAYILNDMHDIESDRLHPKKSQKRPLASGLISIGVALLLLVLLYAVLVYGWFIAPAVIMVIVGYLILNIAYTFVLKYQPVLDIFTIATGFVLRVYAGGKALMAPISVWMFVTTLCLALYLGAIKRRQELKHTGAEGRAVLEKYSVVLIDRYAEMSATGSIVFYSLFVMSSKPELIMTVPLVLYGLFRYWYVVEKLDGGESPADTILSDWQLALTLILWIIACIWALWPQS